MYFNSFVLKIIFAKKQLVVFFIMLISTFVVILFFLFFKTFTTYYIDELKQVYPSVYLVKTKKIEDYALKNIEADAEIFELNLDNFAISFNGNDKFTLGSIGLRSFSKKHIPQSIVHSFEDKKILYVSQKIYALLKGTKAFKGVVYLQSDVNHHMYRFAVKPFHLQDNSKWILIENTMAKKLYRESFFSKAVFYSKLSEDEVKQRVENKFTNMIYTWDENISLMSRALKDSMLYFFSLITIAISVLSISSIIFFARELADDLTHLTRYAFFYGISFSYVYISYLFIANIIISTILLIAYFCAFYIDEFITQTLWSVHSYSEYTFLVYLYCASFVLSVFSFYIWLKRLYSSKVYGVSNA